MRTLQLRPLCDIERLFKPFRETAYAYDGMNDLTSVTQGTQMRTFTYDTYDALGRLVTATNPENGLTTYTNDNNGNLIQEDQRRRDHVLRPACQRPVQCQHQLRREFRL